MVSQEGTAPRQVVAPLGLVLAPLAVPLILIGIGIAFRSPAIGLQPALWIVMLGQTVYVLPLAVLNPFGQGSRGFRRASKRRRCRSAPVVFARSSASWHLPVARPCSPRLLMTFTFAFDEFVIAYFLTNFEITLPIKDLDDARHGL